MKELNRPVELKETIGIAEVKKESKEIYQGSFKLKKGHSVWKYNVETFILDKVEFDSKDIEFQTGKKSNKIVTEKNCLYFSALNRKNAIKKIKNAGLIIPSE